MCEQIQRIRDDAGRLKTFPSPYGDSGVIMQAIVSDAVVHIHCNREAVPCTDDEEVRAGLDSLACSAYGRLGRG